MPRGSATIAFVCLLASLLQGCTVVRTISGTDIDPERFAKAREAAVVDMRTRSALALSERLANGTPLDSADTGMFLSERLVNDAARQMIGGRGWIDPGTPYRIDSLWIRLHPGSALATLRLAVRSETYGVDIDLLMDCLLTFRMDRGELAADFEPFNISPVVSAGGLLASADELIRDLVKVKLARMREELPPMRFPVEFTNQIAIERSRTEVKGKPRLVIDFPRRVINSSVQLREILVFDGSVYLSFALRDIDVK